MRSRWASRAFANLIAERSAREMYQSDAGTLRRVLAVIYGKA